MFGPSEHMERLANTYIPLNVITYFNIFTSSVLRNTYVYIECKMPNSLCENGLYEVVIVK